MYEYEMLDVILKGLSLDDELKIFLDGWFNFI